MPVQTNVGTCCCGGGSHTCGSCSGLPDTLHLTLSGTGCADGTYAVVWNGATWNYGPAGMLCTDCQIQVNVACVGGVFRLTVTLTGNGSQCVVTFDSGTFNVYQTPKSVTCSPLSVGYSLTNTSDCHSFTLVCTTAITVGTITATLTT